MANKKQTTKAEETPQEIKYTKAALAGSKKFEAHRDLLNVLLADGEKYTVAETEQRINNYLNKEV